MHTFWFSRMLIRLLEPAAGMQKSIAAVCRRGHPSLWPALANGYRRIWSPCCANRPNSLLNPDLRPLDPDLLTGARFQR